MIGKVSISKTFSAIVRYVLEKYKAEVLDSLGVTEYDTNEAILDFNLTRRLKPNLNNVVWHASISFAYEDNVPNDKMLSIGHDYLKMMGLDDHQYIMVRHNDAKHAHMHIVANRVGFDGSVASDKWCKNRTAHACDQLEEKYHLTVSREQVRQKSTIKKNASFVREVKGKIHDAISSGLEQGVSDFIELSNFIKDQDIDLKIHRNKTGQIYGVSFRHSELSFKGSSVDKSFSFKRLTKSLSQNRNHRKGYDHGKPREN